MLRVALLISGGGTTAESIIRSTKEGDLKGLVEVPIVISSTTQAGGIEKVQRHGIPVEVIEREKYVSQEEFGEKILSILHQYDVTFVSQNGWLPLTPKNVIEAFNGKIINQHPGPLDPGKPDFGGKGMFGARVVCARLLYCWLTREPHPWTESTVHHVTEEFDKGNIIRVAELPFAAPDRRVSVENIVGSTPVQVYIKHATEMLQKELLTLEHQNVIQALSQISHEEMPLFIREVPLVTDIEMLTQAKRLAIQLFPNG